MYRLDTSFHQPDGHGIPYSAPGSPKVGKALGTASCDDTCLKTWQPYVAPAGAIGAGYWEIATRSPNRTLLRLLERKIDLSHLSIRSATLEDLFLSLTGKELRE